jgi:hypothetical protein
MYNEETKHLLIESLSRGSRPSRKFSSIGRQRIRADKLGGMGGGAGGGMGFSAPPIKSNVKIDPKSEEGILYGTTTVMPQGSSWERQAVYSNYKGIIDKLFSLGLCGGSGVLGSIGQIATNLSYPVKQAVKTIVANQYLGGGVENTANVIDNLSPEDKQKALDFMKKYKDEFAVSGYNPFEEAESYLSSGAVRSDTSKQKREPGMGRLGQEFSKYTGKLAMLGYDPLDFVTKAFGADSVSAAIQDIPDKQRRSALSAGGYLSKGISKGIY